MLKQSVLADKEKFRQAAESSKSKKEFLEKMGLRAAGGTYKFAESWSIKHQIPLPVYDRTQRSYITFLKIEDSLVFCEESTYSNRDGIKKRLLDLGWEYACSVEKCSVSVEWINNPISLQLDHINGIYNDNRLENLRFLCPNCHTQTETYAGKRHKEIKIDRRTLPRLSHRKIDWPPVEETKKMVDTLGYVGTGRYLGVSDNAVRKHLKKYDI